MDTKELDDDAYCVDKARDLFIGSNGGDVCTRSGFSGSRAYA